MNKNGAYQCMILKYIQLLDILFTDIYMCNSIIYK